MRAEDATAINDERRRLMAGFGLGGLLLRVLLVVALALATQVAVFGWVSSNSMMAASVLKHERLRSLGSPKIVLVGGSNLSFGMDSSIIEVATGCPVVNMGLDGFLGVRFLLGEVRSDLKSGDIVVVAWEWDNYFSDVDGATPDHLAVISENPTLTSNLTFSQAMAVLSLVPQATHSRLVRVMGESIEAARVAVMGARPNPIPVSIYTMVYEPQLPDGFSRQGDLLSHLNAAPPEQLMPSRIEYGTPIEPEALSEMQRFGDEMRARGVRVMVSYTPVLRSFYEERKVLLEDVHRRVTGPLQLAAPSPPSEYAYDRSLFFDTVYHLNAEGRVLRARQLAQDLQRQFGAGPLCPRRSL